MTNFSSKVDANSSYGAVAETPEVTASYEPIAPNSGIDNWDDVTIEDAKYLITLSENDWTSHPILHAKKMTLDKIRKEISDHQYDKDEFNIYYKLTAYNGEGLYKYLLDIHSKSEMDFISMISDNYPLVHNEQVILYIDEEDVQVRPFDNRLYYIPKYNAYISGIIILNANGNASEVCYLFCNDKQNFNRLIEDAKAFVDVYKLSRYTVMTDGPNGLWTEYHLKDYSITQDDVIIDADLKKELYGMVSAFFETTFFKDNNIPYKRGILLYGPPGNGKTTFIKSLIGISKINVIIWQINEYSASSSISSLFSAISSKKTPHILIIEDIDSLPDRCRSQFLNALDGVSATSGIFIIGTTNYPNKIDPALMNRAGRFDKTYKFDKPSKETKETYLIRKGIDKFLIDDEIKYLVSKLDKFSMAMLNEIYVQVAYSYHFNNAVIDIDKIVSDITEISKKQERGDFNDDKKSLGFTP